MSYTVFIKDKNLKPENIKKDITILKVKGTFEGGSEPVLQSKTVDVSTHEQIVTADQGYDGLSSVTVNNVQGTYEIKQYTYTRSSYYKSVYNKALVHYYDPKVATKTVDPSTSQQTFNPLNEQVQFYNGITVNAVDASIDSNIQAGNIKKDVTILGVTGTYEPTPIQPTLQDVSVEYTENGVYSLNASSGYDGLGTVDISINVGGGGGSDWVLAVRNGNKNTITVNDAIGNPAANSYAALFKATGLLSVECNTMTEISAANGCTEMFRDCSVLTTASIPNLTSITGDLGAEQMFRNCTSLTDLDLSGLTSINATAGARYLASGCSALTNVDLSNLNTIGKEAACMYMFQDCTSLESVDLSGLTAVKGWVYSQCNSMFRDCTSLKYVDLRNLSTVGGRYDTFNGTFSGCSSLEEIRLDSLTSVSANRTFNGMFTGCTSLTTVTIHPYSLAYNSTEYNPLISAVYIENLYLTDNTTTDVRLDWQPNLTAASVLNVLTHLDLTVSGNSVYFYSSGLTVTDDAQGSIQTAYDAAVAAGWTINNLTITPYS